MKRRQFFYFFSQKSLQKASDSVHLLQPKWYTLKLESFTKPSTLDCADPPLALKQNAVVAPLLLYSNWKMRYTRPGWEKEHRSYTLEKHISETATTKQFLIFHQYYIRGQVTTDCKLTQRDQALVVAIYEISSPIESVSVPAASYLHAKQILCTPEHGTLVITLATTFWTQGSTLISQRND